MAKQMHAPQQTGAAEVGVAVDMALLNRTAWDHMISLD
jgi:hypothetical protein